MMRDYIDHHVLTNKIMMNRLTHKGSMVIVEGYNDVPLYKKFVNRREVLVLPAHGKQNALRALMNVKSKSKTRGVVLVLDTDFDFVIPNSKSDSDIFFTDTHDMETMILESEALEYVLDELRVTEQIIELEKQLKKTFRDILLEASKPIGYLRMISLMDNLGLDFNNIDFKNALKSDMTLDIDCVVPLVQSKNNSQWNKQLKDRIEKSILLQKHSPWVVCCGHDLVGIMSAILLRINDPKRYHDLKPASLERLLRSTYEFRHFAKTKLFKSLRNWEKNNKPYCIIERPQLDLDYD